MASTPQRKKRKTVRPDPNSLAGKLIYFTNLENDKECHDLDQKLLLTYDDQYESEPSYSSYFVFGFIINKPTSKNLREHYRNSAKIVHHDLQQIEAMGSADAFLAQEQLSFIVKRSKSDPLGQNIPGALRTNFRAFTVYECEDLNDARDVCKKLIESKTDFVTSYGFVIIDHDRLLELIELGYAKVRDADPEIVFEKTAAGRTYKAFPDEFNF